MNEREERRKSKSSWMGLGTCSYFSIAVWLLPRSAWHLAGAQETLGEWIHLHDPGVPYASVGLLVLCPLLDCKLVEGGSGNAQGDAEGWAVNWSRAQLSWPPAHCSFHSTYFPLSQHPSLPSAAPSALSGRAMHSYMTPHLSCLAHELFLVCSTCLSSFLCSLLRATYFRSHTLSSFPKSFVGSFFKGWLTRT